MKTEFAIQLLRATRYLEILRRSTLDTVKPMLASMLRPFEAAGVDTSGIVDTVIVGLMSALETDEILHVVAPIYAQHLSAEDLAELVSIHSLPVVQRQKSAEAAAASEMKTAVESWLDSKLKLVFMEAASGELPN